MGRRALCIGINYKGENQLQGCVNDMHDWTAELNRRHFDQLTGLTDQFAPRAAILKSLEHEVQQMQAGKKDLLVVTYSGHGTWIPDKNDASGRDEAICPWDILTAGMQALITDKELFAIFMKKPVDGRIVMISDSCHSGTVTRLLAPLPGAGVQRTPRFISPVQFMPQDSNGQLAPQDYSALKVMGKKDAAKTIKYAALLLSGCKDNEYSYDSVFNGRPNGAFTYAALHALKTLPAGSHYLDWYKAYRKLLPSQDAPQRPMLDGQWDWKATWKIFE